MTVFRGYAARASSNFVIEAANLPLPEATFENYRAQAVFERLAAWLRKHGVTARKPIHELRKEFGSMVNRKHGLSAAKDLLRHADIAITAAHYIDPPCKATSGLGAVLATKRRGKKILEFSGVRQSHVINRAKAEPFLAANALRLLESQYAKRFWVVSLSVYHHVWERRAERTT